MTVVAYDGNTLAADKLVTFGNERGLRPTKKLVALHGRIYGVAGASGYLVPLSEWYDAGHSPDSIPKSEGDLSMLIVEPDGRIFHVHSKAPYPIEVQAPFAIGSGADFAVGAMHAGATAAEAVKIASHVCVSCGGGVDVLVPGDSEQKEAAE